LAATTLHLRPPGRRPTLARGVASLALLLALTGPDAAAAGPWTRSRGGYFAKFSASYLYTRSELDAAGVEVALLTSNPLVRDAAYREVVLASYVEYGLRERVTLVGSLPFKIATSTRTEISSDATLIREIDVTNAGLSDLYIAARGGLVRGRFPAALEAGVKVPLGYERVPANGGPALGTGEVDATALLSAGLAGVSAYASAWVAYRVRGGVLDDDVGFAVEAGAHSGRFFAQALVEGWYTTGAVVPLEVSATMVAPNQDVLKLIASAGARTGEHTSLAAEVYQVLDGRNTATGTTVAVSLVMAR
jgi:hypothetical protein